MLTKDCSTSLSLLERPTLRDYQEELRQELYKSIRSGFKRILVVAPTGAGKTVFAGQIVFDAAIAKGRKVLFAVHRDVLIGQTLDKFSRFDLECGVIAGGYKENRDAVIQVASVQTLSRRGNWFAPDIIVFDEAHLTAWVSWAQRAMPKLRDEQRTESSTIFIGLTATPWRLAKGESMGDLFECLISAPVPGKLIDLGHLVKPSYYGLKRPDLKGVATVGGDFKVSDLEVRCNTPEVVTSAVNEWLRLAEGRRTIAFAVSVSHAHAIAFEFRDRGIPAAAVDGSMPTKERAEIYRDLAAGKILVVASCEALAEGFDCPEVSCVMLCRPTKSKAKFWQQVGRGLRLAADKFDCLVLDQSGLVGRFGFIEDQKRFVLRESMESEKGEAPVKECPNCHAIVPIATRACDCGHCWISEDVATSPVAAMVAMLPKQDIPRFNFYREKLQEAYKKGNSPVWAASLYREKWNIWPPFAWRRNAISEIGGNLVSYAWYLSSVAERSDKDANWAIHQCKLEFGSEQLTAENLAFIRQLFKK